MSIEHWIHKFLPFSEHFKIYHKNCPSNLFSIANITRGWWS